MKVLVMFNVIPEELKCAVVEMTDTEYDYFSIAHNEIINAGDSDPNKEDVALVISQAFCESPTALQYCEGAMQMKYFGKWKHDESIIDLSEVQKLICCGIYM